MKRLNWGMIGGGEGSQIGPAHRLGVAADRAYGDWREMLAGESAREDRVDLVTVATPNSTHFEITKAFLEGGFNVLCEKPMTMTV